MSSKQYRSDIQGLRALAALLVAAYHIWFHRVSGAVDLFFFISAYFMTASLLRRLPQQGIAAVTGFWRDLGRRLLPQAWAVLAVTAVASMLLTPMTWWRQILDELRSASIFTVNWTLAFNDVAYIHNGDTVSPVQHFWAMAVQMQVYLVWPLLIGAGVWGARMLRQRTAAADGTTRRTMVAAVLAVVAIASLAYSIVTTGTRQPFAYYDTFARVWEFAAGGLFALALPHLRLPAWARVGAGWAGVLGLICFGMIADVSSSFPGAIAAVPLTFAALIFISGDAAGASRSGASDGHGRRAATAPDVPSATRTAAGNWIARFGVGRWLSSRPLTWLGGISYGIYLWHWPIMTLWLAHTRAQQLTWWQGAVVIGAAIGLAWVTTRFIEQPIRSPKPRSTASAAPRSARIRHRMPRLEYVRRLERRPIIRVAGLAALLGIVVGGWQHDINRITQRSADAQNPGASILTAGYDGPKLFETLQPAITALNDEWADWSSQCDTIGSHGAELITCVNLLPDHDGERADAAENDAASTAGRTIFIAGDSHIDTWMTLLGPLAERQGWNLRTFVIGGCPMQSDGIGKYQPDETQRIAQCQAMNNTLLDAVAAERPDAVFTVGNVSIAGSPDVVFADSLTTQVRRITDLGVPVVLMRDNPRFGVAPSTCVSEAADLMLGVDVCSVSRENALADVDFASTLPETLAQDPLVLTLDLADLFCPDGTCPPAIGGRLVYIDDNHPTRAYVQTLAPWFDSGFTDVFGRAAAARDAAAHVAI